VPAIITTHDLAYADSASQAALSDNGRRLWDRLIRDNDQIFLTLNGHYWPPGRTILKNAAGHDVHVHITNYQDRYYGGAAMIRLYTFELARNAIDVETFSPWFLARDPERRTPLEAETIELTGPVDRFSLAVDFSARFAGFDPPALPAPRPAAAVVDRATVAYWRFDTPGQSVTDGSVVRDLTGKGNDLTVRRLANSGPDMVSLSTDHHVGQPAHASLRFDGGTSPDRGAILETAPNAVLNSMKFETGYTIEVFLKYPNDRDADPTSWSHALPVGRWTHVAVVNNGRRTIVWVDGSKIARNPTQPSPGIATLGRPFVIGATSFDLQYDQGFYGWIGDVRITGRALTPDRFLPAATSSPKLAPPPP